MFFTIDKESLLNKLKIVEKVSSQRGIQAVLANILFDAKNNELTLSATDLDLSIVSQTTVSVKEEGSITLPAKKLLEIASKLPDKPVIFELNKETNIVKISCGNAKFEVIGISSEEFPTLLSDEEKEDFIEVDSEPFLKAIKNTVYATANYENRNILSGVFCKISGETLEMAATDGNRLTIVKEKIKNQNSSEIKMVIPSKTVQEYLRVSSFSFEEKVKLLVNKTKLTIKTKSYLIKSRLLEGEYPPYEQLIPKTTASVAIVSRDELIYSLDRVSCMVNDRTGIVKFSFSGNKLNLMADEPNAGASEDNVECNYNGDDFVIAFNYKYVLDSIKTMNSKEVNIGLNGSLSATVFKPNNEEEYICLIMPMQIR